MKRFIFWFLIIFVVAACLTRLSIRFQHRDAVQIPDGFNLVFCRAQTRCPTCIKMERLIYKTLAAENDPPRLILLEYDHPANRPFAERFHIGTAGIILLEQKNGQPVLVQDITVDTWNHLDNETGFISMLQNKIKIFIDTLSAE